ncbi:MAG TPA: MFS transporter [Micromonosporaceae bacterium]|nr:MFS transporter [Micromonosporaceae bacterium]
MRPDTSAASDRRATAAGTSGTDGTFSSPTGRRIAVGVGGLAVLLAAIDAYVVVSIFVNILNSLGLPINRLERATPIVTGYLLGYVAGMPLLARVSDRYGRRIVIYAGLAGFAGGSALTGWAPTENWLVIGRTVQGVAGGALLPVTLALAADLFAERSRARVLGGVGAAQELGSVIGPLYGAWIASMVDWQWVFWINIPLAAVAAALVHRAVPARSVGDAVERPRVDVIGGLLLAACLGVLVAALNNQHPENGVLPPNGPLLIGISAALLVAFVVWEMTARTKLMSLTGVAKRPFFASIATSLIAGAGLLATLLFITLDAQTVLEKTAGQASVLLARFLIALPIGAIIGGFLVRRLGERIVTVGGLLIAAFGYWLVSRWPIAVLAASHHIGPIRLPMFDTDMAIAGLGLGLIIAPLAAAVLRSVPPASHGIASAALVVARMMGMLVGVSALAAWGLHKFQVLTANLVSPLPINKTQAQFNAEEATYEKALFKALQQEYRSIFFATAIVCVVGAVVALALDGRRAQREADDAREAQLVTQ